MVTNIPEKLWIEPHLWAQVCEIYRTVRCMRGTQLLGFDGCFIFYDKPSEPDFFG